MKLERLKVLHLSGVPALHELEFCGGITVMIGPNGSGKSSILRLVSESLWPTKNQGRGEAILTWQPDSPRLSSFEFKLDADKCEALSLANRTFQSRRHDCYFFRIDDLIVSRDSHLKLAQRIAKEMAGGLDLEAWKKRVRRKVRAGSKERKALAAALVQYRHASQQQERLARDESELLELRQKHAEATSAQNRIVLLETRLAQIDLEKERQQRIEELRAIEPMARRIQGNEDTILDRLRHERKVKLSSLAEVSGARQIHEQTLENLGLGRDLIPTQITDSLHRAQETFARLINDLSRESLALATEQSQFSFLVDGVETDIANASLPSALALRKFSSLMQQAQRTAIERAATREQIDASAATADSPPFAPLESWRRQLNFWLAIPEINTKQNQRLAQTSVMVSLSIASLAILNNKLNWAWPPLAFSCGILVYFLLDRQRSQNLAREKSRIEEEYLDTNQPEPITWTRRNVQVRIDEIEVLLDSARWHVLNHNRILVLNNRMNTLEQDATKQKHRASQFVKNHGLRMGNAPPLEVVAHLDRIQRLRDVAQRIAKHEGAIRHIKLKIAETRDCVHETLDQLGVDAARMPEELLSQIGGLLEDIELQGKEAHVLTHKICHETSLKGDVEDLQTRIEAIFASLALKIDDDASLTQLISQNVQLKEKEKFATSLEHKSLLLTSQLAEHPQIAKLTQEEIRFHLAAAHHLESQLATIIDQLIAIEGELTSAKKNHDLNDAKTNVRKCRAALAQVRRDQIDRSLQAEIINMIAEDQFQNSDPQVFSLAKRLFSEFTNHEWQMIVDAENGFRAKDLTNNINRELDALSTGTRIQLIMAARLAFVETQEDGEALPLFFDEVLSSSDERRTQVIAKTLAKTANRGRQLIYSTVDRNDIEVLRNAAEKEGVAISVIDLAKMVIQAPAAQRILRQEDQPGQSANELS